MEGRSIGSIASPHCYFRADLLELLEAAKIWAAIEGDQERDKRRDK